MAASTASCSLQCLHTRRDLLRSCEELLKSIWPHSATERLYRLESEECIGLPCSLVLIEHRAGSPDEVIGHVRLVKVSHPETPKSAFIEGVCVKRSFQGSGLGKKLMQLTEQYMAEELGYEQAFLICLAPVGDFYRRLSYEEFPILTLETVGANLLLTFDRVSWYGNKPAIGWESAYEDGPIVSEDEMRLQAYGQLTMRKYLQAP
ncbi:uncharacterized protein LOC119746040 [Patiria miniata]|uniref:N-acetyltransferase domain-containing protein n=1 Tax=Patiria miniata TaxID=46514 RepID=A0A914BSZ6_PATMI|nr:uncharacterized protein LOC119746040 [Patiria miniata]